MSLFFFYFFFLLSSTLIKRGYMVKTIKRGKGDKLKHELTKIYTILYRRLRCGLVRIFIGWSIVCPSVVITFNRDRRVRRMSYDNNLHDDEFSIWILIICNRNNTHSVSQFVRLTTGPTLMIRNFFKIKSHNGDNL